MLTNHRPLILNWFRTWRCHSFGVVEGLNLKSTLALRRTYDCRTYDAGQLSLYHTFAHPPQPPNAKEIANDPNNQPTKTAIIITLSECI